MWSMLCAVVGLHPREESDWRVEEGGKIMMMKTRAFKINAN